MAKTKANLVSTQTEQGKFLLAKNITSNTRFYGKRGELGDDLVLPEYQSTVIDPRWRDVPHFASDVTKNLVQLSWSNTVPDAVSLLPADKWKLSNVQKQIIGSIVRADTLTPQLLSNINLSRWIDENGMPKEGTTVSIDYLKKEHVQFLKALLETEKGFRNRKEFLDVVNAELATIKTLANG